MLTQQLGYSPPNLVEVAAWTAAGTPAVIRAHPLLSRRGGVEPFPTTYWLTCPQIKAAVGTVERDRGVKRAAAHLADEAGEAAMRAAHASYAADRWGQGSKRVIQRRFNVSVPRARVSKTAPTLRERSER